jgi:hypothetical protein
MPEKDVNKIAETIHASVGDSPDTIMTIFKDADQVLERDPMPTVGEGGVGDSVVGPLDWSRQVRRSLCP